MSRISRVDEGRWRSISVEGQEEEDPEVVVGQPGNLHDQLDEVAPEVALHLPVHYRCGYVHLIINCYFNNIFPNRFVLCEITMKEMRKISECYRLDF